jgi:hypothetical protein
MNNAWYVTQEVAAAHRRDLREMRGHTYHRRQPRQFRLPRLPHFHRAPQPAEVLQSAEARHAWQ